MKQRAFTLIELLIVVAIIAILAAIAVPNFLEAQTRSKVSRAKADLRSVAVAIESYSVDNNKYPLVTGSEGTLEKRYSPITTPVAYITSIPVDPFGADLGGLSYITPPYRYRLYDFVTDTHDPTRVTFFVRGDGKGFCQVNNVSCKWYNYSQGPDKKSGLANPDPTGNFFVIYDPTNGTISDGDIFRYGPGGS